MKSNTAYIPHIVTLAGLGFACLALMAIFDGDYAGAARFSLLVLLVDRIDGTLARGLKSKQRLPHISGEILDLITDLVGLTFVPMVLFWKTGLFLNGMGGWLVIGATIAASLKYARKDRFLEQGFSVGAPPIFFSVFLFYFLSIPPLWATYYVIALIILVLSPIRYPITSLVTTHWRPSWKSITNYLTAFFFVPAFLWLDQAPVVIYWIMLTAILVQLSIYPILMRIGIIRPVFDRSH